MDANDHPRVHLYRERLERFSAELATVKRKINNVSNLRIAIAIAFVLLFYRALYNPYLFLALPVLAVAFVVLVLIHSRLFIQKVHLENLTQINKSEIDSTAGKRDSLHNGSEFIDPHHSFTHDLDIFGAGSLYQLINRCNTFDGRASLAKLFSQPLASKEEITTAQLAVKELAPEINLRQNLGASGLEINELPSDRQQLLAWLNIQPIAYGNSSVALMLWVLPVITILSCILYFFDLIPQIIPVAFVLIQWGIWGRYSKKINLFHDYISRKKEILEKYAQMLAVIRNENVLSSTDNGSGISSPAASMNHKGFESALLKELVVQATDAGSRVNALVSLVGQLNARLNFLTAIFVNSLFLYDLRCVYRLEKWKADNALKLPQWLDAISRAEVLSSLANFAYNHPHCQFPIIQDEQEINADELGHPLLNPSECVTNSVTIGPAPTVLVITGANMAGKSTFLRSLGVNFVLALTGAPVYAKAFKCPVVPLRSGMRTADSLKDHESYFYAELNRLKSIMDELRENKPLFILLDEILKGTNSNDKQKGSIALVRQLMEHPCLGVIATHDLALGMLENEYPSSVKNHCFEASIENDQLSFDYKLKSGVAKNMNATFLMKKMGILRN
ncbi:hypothetical protein WBG78_13010 [Chryseolinea sp. T2]|uniref:MutS-related protein n=1 Tax=Chryseolinea sp. T2 TaxID=3129255 RepID=UPI003076F187